MYHKKFIFITSMILIMSLCFSVAGLASAAKSSLPIDPMRWSQVWKHTDLKQMQSQRLLDGQWLAIWKMCHKQT